MSQSDLINQQAETIGQLNTELSRLRKRNYELEQILKRDLQSQTVSFQDMKDKFGKLERQILPIIISLAKRYQRPMNYAEIVKGVTNKLPFKIQPTTIRRTVRKLREDGHLMKEGTDRFFPCLKTEVTQ